MGIVKHTHAHVIPLGAWLRLLKRSSIFFLPPHTLLESQQLWRSPQKFSVCLGIVSLRLVVQLTSRTRCIPVLSTEIFAGHVQENYYGKDLELFRGRN